MAWSRSFCQSRRCLHASTSTIIIQTIRYIIQNIQCIEILPDPWAHRSPLDWWLILVQTGLSWDSQWPWLHDSWGNAWNVRFWVYCMKSVVNGPLTRTHGGRIAYTVRSITVAVERETKGREKSNCFNSVQFPLLPQATELSNHATCLGIHVHAWSIVLLLLENSLSTYSFSKSTQNKVIFISFLMLYQMYCLMQSERINAGWNDDSSPIVFHLWLIMQLWCSILHWIN